MSFRKVRTVCMPMFLLLISYTSYGQVRHLNKVITAEKDQPLTEILALFQEQEQVRIFYLEEWLQSFHLSRDYTRIPLKDVLNSELDGSGIQFVELYDYAIIFYKDVSKSIRRDSIMVHARENNRVIEFMSIGKVNNKGSGGKVLITGTVRDELDEAPLPGASIFVEELNAGYSADQEGKFALDIPPGEYILTVRFTNYQEKLIHLVANENGHFNITLEGESILLDEVVIGGQSILKSTIGQIRINLDDLNRSPAFLGEIDVIRQIQTQSGVTTVSEASSGFNVRGGSVDQNLILFDGVPIFNTAHALGFFTAFNSNTIQETSFYKGAIPAEFGGRISSVLDITSKEGNYSKWESNGGIGLISSHLFLGGPLKKDKSSIAVSVRSSYSDWMLGLLQTRFKDISDASVFFYDGNLKYTNKLSENSKLTGSVYVSRDRFSLASDTVNRWNNLAASLRYDKKINQRMFYSAGLYFGKYDYTLSDDEDLHAFNLNYEILYPAFKLDFNRDGLHKQSFGLHVTGYNFEPGRLTPTSAASQIMELRMPSEKSVESAMYFSDNFQLNDRIEVEAGIRLSMFNRFGPGKVYQYNNDRPRESQFLIDSVMFRDGQIIKTYLNPEPRLAINIQLNSNSTAKIGYNRSNQYLHLVTNTAAVTPVDIWQSSNSFFRPQQSDQFSFGYFRNSKSNAFELSIETYYKWQKNILEFKDGARLILNRHLETSLLNAEARAYGIELTANKLKGRLTGTFNYTFSRSIRKVEGQFETEIINRGEWFPANMDQPHVVNLNWRYSFTRRVFLSGNFTYHTGRPVSVPTASYAVDGNLIMDFEERNNYRIPDYHRMDLSFVVEGSSKKNKRMESSWLFSIYNVYGRRNPYSVFFIDVYGQFLKPYQLSLIGTAVPSLTYQFKF